MKRFDIKIISINKKDICMIFSTTYLSPLKFIAEVEKEISSFTNDGIEVIFDFFLSNGNTRERYAKAYFNGVNIVRESFEYTNINKNDSLRSFSAEFYKDSIDKMDFSFLTSIQKKMIAKGIAI
ncbi:MULTISPECIES: type II toxin-antitoxin system RnlB family antitoxin [Pelosinus]|uniref:Uncharacterized protein n=2 Tax=Pelosinus TaxID=365348 RepID=I8RKI3_9FIRM|nr:MULTISPECIES: type II toxin-antitoxin system RnlB family antitoxin [Pelosinus]EIW20728.1 hypothetical protein FB4_1940 [Pelosinus fermentans B4]EIW25427.1 hypothetical protein FA11_2586 [Pelosinus fermentans A11]OAM93685.1 hypothetical protein FR7_01702 [Pelosinus fermentans DSM 17108]SDQ86520.1 Antitoxin to toxin RNase LS or RnlA [Pelosinus fermentans]